MVWNIPQHPDLFLKNFQCQSVFDRLLLKFLMLDVAVWFNFRNKKPPKATALGEGLAVIRCQIGVFI